jgi:flavodoxin
MKALVTYYSQTGNTEKLARAIYEAIPIHVEKELLPVQDVKGTAGCDIIFVGFPVHSHSVPARLLPFFKSLPGGQNIALFCTHGSLRSGQLPRQALEHAIGLSDGSKVVGTFSARGRVDAQIIDSLMKQAEHRAWAEEAQGADEHPTEADLADGREFARSVLAKVGLQTALPKSR